MAEGKILSDCY